MIYVDRNSVDCPTSLLSGGEGEHEQALLSAFISDPEKHRQQRFRFRALHKTDVFPALLTLCSEKCAYCEMPIPSQGSGIDHYRPRASVAEATSHPGYWWLANRWDNLLLVCHECNAAKSHRFPLADEKSRAFIIGAEVNEQPLLLDPASDNPAEHFVYDERGYVSGATLRGQTTIALLRLNRDSLVQARCHAAMIMKTVMTQFEFVLFSRGQDNKESLATLIASIKEMTADHSPFAAIKRQLLVSGLYDQFTGQEFQSHFAWSKYNRPVSQRQLISIKSDFNTYLDELSDYSLANTIGHIKSRALKRSVEHIEIENFKSLEKVKLSVTPDWFMLLGENGVGKSSVLHAVGLCISGANNFAELLNNKIITPDDFIKKGKDKATISVQISGFVGQHRLIIRHQSALFKRPVGRSARVSWKSGQAVVTGDREARNEQQVLLGYGATRLLSRDDKVGKLTGFHRIDNLFDPFVTLIPADKWLAKAPIHLFDQAALLLKDLLSLNDDVIFVRREEEVLVSSPEQEIPLGVLSDGFKAVIALTIDIFSVAERLWGSPENAEGIVLLDELDCHLHPTWKMRIVSGLRRAFPGMQFIVTTHDPLCLRGLQQGEICLMKKDEIGRVTANTDLPDPADFRVDQLLTSSFFGLNTTRDPQDEVLFDEYYALLSLSERDEAQTAKLAQLKSELKDRRYVGDTAREQLMFEAVDQVIANRRSRGKTQVYEMKEEVVEAISALWDEVLNETFTDHDKD
ncbi:AAA family ATPase [Pantoea agglomerans]|uniref:AAA family ATPase n=1 Tax=Enterobacter agglomerans TaxID=549 RepID=A0ACC5RKU9_ENTAG|nr:AAA family ATPase [Pantoea agglomerans]MBK4725337.1 AAA family ATPase [Pantoea agglomerans]